ncbi:efflux RND transporter periplasmic adaptor subunit [Novosphingobium sp. ST904]|uniref:efflux RND transporter periplasmic adaptor subunit n=1 Tax=Novosphingobium sp. ST904 TaxID=1684385 RepID=UPI00104C465B|nr:efflux RND transporter periplasmic adaptor subunit [Novosphingobium sp. ST904]TCM23710.1 macrolide-specific efflux system membrane fusion protein [Novosphingobium sp. ST904]
MFTKRRLVIGGILIGVALLALLAWKLLSGPAAPVVATAEVTRGTIEQTVEATGTLEPKELVSVGAQVSGRLEELKVAVGDTVRQGDLIGLIDPRTQTNSLATAKADLGNMQAQLAGAKATLAKAELAFRRQQALGVGEATSRADFEAARAEQQSAQASYDALVAQIRSASVNVDTAQVQLGYTKITAPMDGVVVAVVTKQGQTVNANQSAPTIVILAKLDVMTVKAEVSEADVINVKPGLPVYFTILGDPDRRYEAKLRLIEPAPESIVNEVNSTSTSSSSSSTAASAIYYNALFEVPNNDGRLRALMTAKVSIVLASRGKALVIPSTALGTKSPEGLYSVRVKGADGKITSKRVRIGVDNNVNAEVLSGLNEGEEVVVGEASATKTAKQGPMGPPPG